MGTRINVMMNHDVDDYRDQSAVLTCLEATLPAALAVRDYWNANNPFLGPETEDKWVADPVMTYEKHYRSYTGPGSLFLKVGPRMAKIRTGGRWRGFLSIPPLRAVHLKAFRSIGLAVGATHLAYFLDCDDAWEVLYNGGKYEEAVPILTGYFGPPQPSIDSITPEVAEEAEDGMPGIWYSEELPSIKIIV